MEEIEDLCPESWFQVRAPEDDKVQWWSCLCWKVCFWCCCLPICYPCYFTRTYRNNKKKIIKQQPLLHRPPQLQVAKQSAIPRYRSLHCLRAEQELKWVETPEQGAATISQESGNINAETQELCDAELKESGNIPAETQKLHESENISAELHESENIPAELKESESIPVEPQELSPTPSQTRAKEATPAHESENKLPEGQSPAVTQESVIKLKQTHVEIEIENLDNLEQLLNT